LTRFLLHYVLSFQHLSSNVLLVKQIEDRCQSGCYLLKKAFTIRKQLSIAMFTVHSSRFRWEADFSLLRQQPYIQNRKSIPTYKITYFSSLYRRGVRSSQTNTCCFPGCSTSARRSSAAKQWCKQLAPKKKKEVSFDD